MRFTTTLYVDRRHTVQRHRRSNYREEVLSRPSGPAIPTPAVDGACQADLVHLLDLGPYVENTTHWTSWLRTIIGAREEYYHATDQSFVTGFQRVRQPDPCSSPRAQPRAGDRWRRPPSSI